MPVVFRAGNIAFQMLFILTVIHQNRSKQGDQKYEYCCHPDGISDMPNEQFDIFFLFRILRNDIGVHFGFVEQMPGVELNFILNQYLVNFQHPDPKIHVEKQHRHKHPDNQ